MKNNRCVVALSIMGVLVLAVVLFLGSNKYKEQQAKIAEYKKIALEEQQLEKE